jgi:hypothetical protein
MLMTLALLTSLTLVWDPNTEPDIAGYKLYCGEASGRYIASIDVGNVTQFQPTLKNLNPGDKAFFIVSAYNTSGLESDSSNEVSYTKPTLSQPKLEISVNAFGMVELAWITVPGLFYTVWYKDNFESEDPNTWQSAIRIPGNGEKLRWSEAINERRRMYRLEVSE